MKTDITEKDLGNCDAVPASLKIVIEMLLYQCDF